MKRTLVLDVVGLTPALLVHAPNLTALAARGGLRSLTTVTPAVTTTVQSTLVTGAPPREHGIVGNGWYFRDLAEIWFWRQSNHLVSGEKLWDAAKRHDPSFTCAKLFWWYNMYASTDFSVTHARCIRPTVASCPTCTRILRSFATNCSASSGSSRCSGSGGPRPTSNPLAGSAAARCAFSSVTARR